MKLAALALISGLYGLLTGYIFRRLTDPASIGMTVDRIIAHILELRLFIDEPRTILHAQRDLLRTNLQLIKKVFFPLAISALLFAALFSPLDRRFGHGPLTPGEPVVVRVATLASPLRLDAPPEVKVETPAVQAVYAHETSWRIRPAIPTRGRFSVTREGRAIPESLDIPWPQARIFHIHWLVWFFLISTAAAVYELAQPI